MNIWPTPDWRITINKSKCKKRSLFYHVDKNRDKKVTLKHRGAIYVTRNHTRSLRKSIFKLYFIKIARDARMIYYIDSVVLLYTWCSNMLCCGMLRKSLSLSLSLFEGPFYLKKVLYVPSVFLEAFVNCSNKITWHFQHLFTSFILAPNYRT